MQQCLLQSKKSPEDFGIKTIVFSTLLTTLLFSKIVYKRFSIVCRSAVACRELKFPVTCFSYIIKKNIE